MPSFKQIYLEDFASRDDLLDAALASAHIPFLLDWRPAASAAGRQWVDGSLKGVFTWSNSDLLTRDGAAFVVDYSQVGPTLAVKASQHARLTCAAA